ncbi:MAG: ethanolamine ammonia-lyase reactivating factor EutA [Oscillospiraceae bacterium]
MNETESMISVGIDIGTTTTQLVFSQLTLKTSGGFGMTSKTEVSDKKVLNRSRVYFTPLNNDGSIDAPGVRRIIEQEYAAAGFRPEMIDTGAVIITGETVRRSNSRSVCEEISGIAGDFVVTSAGPDLESILAGKGAGCLELSEQPENLGKICCNLDIGGGTTNIACFRGGEVISVGCLDIGGRLIRLDRAGRMTYISDKLRALAERSGIALKPGSVLTRDTAERVCEIMCAVLEAAVGLAPASKAVEYMATNHSIDVLPDLFTFSGGVADCISGEQGDFEYGDIGVVFGRVLRRSEFFGQGRVLSAAETLRATVIGAGNCSIELSGSTIEYQNCGFPIKSVPVLRQRLSCGGDIAGFADSLRHSIENCGSLVAENRFAIAFDGIRNPSFDQIERLAAELVSVMDGGDLLMIVVKEDMAKALGQALRRRIPRSRPLICIDGIVCGDGDFIDIGEPVSGGRVIPAVVKTLIFK